jgi:hypothetical protein
VEKTFVEQSLARYDQQCPATKTKARQGHQQHSYRAVRCTVLRGLLGEDYRGMSRRLAECALFRWFCGMEELAAVRVPGKSTLQDYGSRRAPPPWNWPTPSNWKRCGWIRRA